VGAQIPRERNNLGDMSRLIIRHRVSSELQKTADLTDVVSNEDLGGNHVLGGSTDPPGKDILGVFPH